MSTRTFIGAIGAFTSLAVLATPVPQRKPVEPLPTLWLYPVQGDSWRRMGTRLMSPPLKPPSLPAGPR
jgi:hypothetical protein